MDLFLYFLKIQIHKQIGIELKTYYSMIFDVAVFIIIDNMLFKLLYSRYTVYMRNFLKL